MNRALYALVATAAALIPITASAAPSPTPSPSLDQVLAPPPTGFVELTTSNFNGHFNAHDYGQNAGTDKASQVESTLNHDGMVDGYGKTWIQATAGHALVELVIAFSGGKGAHDWLTQAEAGDKSDPSYVHPDTMNGIANYYGGHFTYSADNTVGDVFVFAKGNDVYEVGAVSTKDDVLTLATSQTTAQYNSAPNQTIPSSQWPENKTTNSAAFQAGAAFAGVLIVAVVVGLILLVVFLVIRSRRRTPAYAGATYAPPPMSGPMPGPEASPAAPIGVQMSDDGRYWWDGQNWRDTEHEAPPSAQRSSDGMLWWDGRNWRPVPQPQGPPS